MADTITPNSDTTPEPTATGEAKSHFAKAMDEAKAGAKALGKEAQDRAGTYREKAGQAGSEWVNEARSYGDEAKAKAAELASEGKASATRAISGLGKLVEDNAAMIDEKVGPKYGEYARTAGKSIQDAAARLDAKELGDIGEDAKEFVRKSPGVAVGIAAVAGFMLARLFGGGKKD